MFRPIRTQDEVAAIMGITHQNVSQGERTAMKKIKEALRNPECMVALLDVDVEMSVSFATRSWREGEWNGSANRTKTRASAAARGKKADQQPTQHETESFKG